MIETGYVGLGVSASLKLASWQQYVDSARTYEARVERAKLQFPLANRVGNATFAEIKQKLTAMCSGARRCMYCEDSVADEVEHHHPKDLYPEKTFVWENYLYACGPCNSPKGNKFAIIENGVLVVVTRTLGQPVVPPRVGTIALLDPRTENPLAFLVLDIVGDTFRFTPHPLTDGVGSLRAQYTIDTLGLNKKDFLIVARREAYHSYLARLRQYAASKNNPNVQPTLDYQRNALLRMQHPTVFREMLRQADRIKAVSDAVVEAPEIANW